MARCEAEKNADNVDEGKRHWACHNSVWNYNLSPSMLTFYRHLHNKLRLTELSILMRSLLFTQSFRILSRLWYGEWQRMQLGKQLGTHRQHCRHRDNTAWFAMLRAGSSWHQRQGHQLSADSDELQQWHAGHLRQCFEALSGEGR